MQDGVFVVLDSFQEISQDRGERKGDKGDGDSCQNGPDDGGMPLPAPELTREGDGVGAGGVEELIGGERHGLGVEETAAGADEGDDEEELEGVDDVVAELGGGYVEAEDEGGGEAEDGCGAEDGVEADEEANGDAPG